LLNYTQLLNAENSISNKQEFVSACIKMLNDKLDYGIYNVTNGGAITTQQVADILKNSIGKEKDYKFVDEDEFYKHLAKAPRSSCVLSNQKLLDVGIKMRTAEEALQECVNNWKQ